MRPDRARTALLIGLFVLPACGFVPDPTPDPIPTEAQAIAFMRELVALAQAGDLDGMCRHAGGSNCDDLLEAAGGRLSVPSGPPILAGTRLIPGTSSGNSGTVGGMLLVLCGTDGRQRPYRTEMLVSRFHSEVYAINAVYWSGSKLAVSSNSGAPSGGAGIDCP